VPGTIVNLPAWPARTPREAAKYYPAIQWFSLIDVPAKSDFPGTGANGINPVMKSQAMWVRQLKTDGCITCHQIGNQATREVPKEFQNLENSTKAWERRVLSGQAGPNMGNNLSGFGPRGAQMFADWTDRIAAGEVPPAPARPQGKERNVVVTVWDWA